MFSKNLSTSILQLCSSRDLSYEEAAERCDLSPRYFGSIARGQTNVSLSTFEKLCKGFELTPNEHTIFEADGIYRHEDGRQVSEKTLRVELLMVEEGVVRRIVDFLKAALNQESIAVQMQDVASVLW